MGLFDYKKKNVSGEEETAPTDTGIKNDSKNQYTRQQRQRLNSREQVAANGQNDSVNKVETHIKRNFVITKRKKPLRFIDINLKSTEYEYVNTERLATIFDSMTNVLSMMDKLFKNGNLSHDFRYTIH